MVGNVGGGGKQLLKPLRISIQSYQIGNNGKEERKPQNALIIAQILAGSNAGQLFPKPVFV